MAKKKELNAQQYKMAAPGAGALIYLPHFDNNATYNGVAPNIIGLSVLISRRTAEVGEGLGIFGGGFFNCNTLIDKPVGTILTVEEEAYRECGIEENPGFTGIMPFNVFEDRAQSLTNFVVRTQETEKDQAGVHAPMYLGVRTTVTEFRAIEALPESSERSGALVKAFVDWSPTAIIPRSHPEQYTNVSHSLSGVDFFHPHEKRAFGMLAWLAQRNKLWLN